MREELFRYFWEFGYYRQYHSLYKIHVRRISDLYSGVIILASAGSVATLSIWNKYQMLWAFIALAAQILQTLKPLMQFSKRRQALEYIIQDDDSIFNDLCSYWNKVNYSIGAGIDDASISEHIDDYRRRAKESQSRFISGLDFPINKRIQERAENLNGDFFKFHYSTESGETYA